MKRRCLVLGLVVGAVAMHAHAQEMPGMRMGAQATQPQQPSTSAGMPNRTKQSPDPAASMIQEMGQDSGDRRAKAAAASEQDSVEQQSGETQARPAPKSDASSITIPMQEVQEPEAVGFRTGSDLPAPELLGAVVNLEPLTLASFLNLAEKTNPTLAQAQRSIDRSKEQARQVGLPPNPSLGYSGDHIRGGEYHGGEQGAFFVQEFVLGGKLALRRKVYLAQGRSNDFALEAQRARVHNDVARAFFEALTAQQSVVLHDRLLKVALDAATNAHELMRVGQMDAAAVLTAEIAAEQTKIDFVTAQRTYLANFAQLAASAGQAELPPHPLTGALVAPPKLDPDSMVATDALESPAVKQAEANVGVAEARVKSARREPVPNLTLKAGEWYSGEELGAAGLKAAKTDPGRAGFESFVEASVQVPLWNRNQGNVQAAKAELDRAQRDVQRTQLLTRSQTVPYAQQYQSARFAAERYRTEMLPRARRAYQLQVMKYQQMALAYPEVLTAQRLLFTLQLGYIQALNEEWRAAIALQNYALADGLDAPMSVGADSTALNLPTGGSQ